MTAKTRQAIIAIYTAVIFLTTAYFVFSTSGMPVWQRLFPWVLVYRYLGNGAPTTFEKFELIDLPANFRTS